MINITGIDLCKFAKDVYSLSVPRGLGHLHYRPGPLPDAEAKAIVKACADDKELALHMDYVLGRCCKMIVFRKKGKWEDRLWIRNEWPDHTEAELTRLLSMSGIERANDRRYR